MNHPKNLVNSDWSILRVDEVFEIKQGKQVSKKNRIGDNQKHFLRTKNVFWNKLDLSELDTMHFKESDEKRLELKYGDLLLCEGGSVGRTAIWKGEFKDCYYQNHLHRLRAIKDYDFNFALYWFWYAFEYSSFYSGRKNNTTIPNLSRSRLSELPIPNPPLEEQKKIAAVLSLVQEAISQQEKAIALTTELKKALMQKLFTEGTRNETQKMTEIGLIPESWEVVNLKSILREPLKNGHSAKEINSGDGIPTLTLTAVTKNDFSPSNIKQTCADPHKVKDIWLKKNDILIERANTLEYVGLAALYEAEDNFAIFPDLLIRVRVKEEYISPKVLLEYLLINSSRIYFRKNVNSTTGNFPKINQKVVQKMLVPIMEIEEQQKIEIGARLLDEKTTLLQNKKDILNELFQTLLHQLMTAQIRVDDLDLSPLNF